MEPPKLDRGPIFPGTPQALANIFMDTIRFGRFPVQVGTLPTLCYASVLPGRKSVFRPGNPISCPEALLRNLWQMFG